MIRKQMGLDKPVPQQLLLYLGDLSQGNLGRSLTTGQPVLADLRNRLPASLELTLTALLIALLTAVPLGIIAALRPGSVLVDHTTGSAALAAELAAEAAARGLHFIDAPVSGGEAGAQKGQLTVMCGGDEQAFAAVEAVIRAYAKMVRRLGGPGAGQKTKMVNQICIAGLVQALAEGVHFAEKAGLDPDAVIDVISKGAAQSWQMENRAGTMHQRRFDFGFAVNWMRKDLRIALAEARQNGATLPVTVLVDQFYADVERMGGQRWDTSSLIARLSE
jgi:3-hydroxyisobutyrate dehydrogenase-like beta-hydroxyacid dehydrogenase